MSPAEASVSSVSVPQQGAVVGQALPVVLPESQVAVLSDQPLPVVSQMQQPMGAASSIMDEELPEKTPAGEHKIKMPRGPFREDPAQTRSTTQN